MVGSVDWTNVLVALIAGLPAIIAAIAAVLVHQQVKTPSGPSIGEQVERSHLTAIANNMLLSRGNGPTKNIDADAVKEENPDPPQIPDEEGAA